MESQKKREDLHNLSKIVFAPLVFDPTFDWRLPRLSSDQSSGLFSRRPFRAWHSRNNSTRFTFSCSGCLSVCLSVCRAAKGISMNTCPKTLCPLLLSDPRTHSTDTLTLLPASAACRSTIVSSSVVVVVAIVPGLVAVVVVSIIVQIWVLAITSCRRRITVVWRLYCRRHLGP